MKKYKMTVQWILLLLFGFGGQAMAQSTIFNIPTTDTVAKGKAYTEFDFLPQVPGADGFRIYTYNPRLVVGAPHNIEVGVNFPTFNTRSSGDSTTFAYIQPNIKWKFYDNEKAGVAMAAGFLWNSPLNKRDGQDSWGMVYGVVSKKVKSSDYGPRFHGGAFGIVSANQDPLNGPVNFVGPRAGAIAGYEQPVSKKVSIVADWFSGKNNIGYFTPGVSISLPKNALLNAGYSFGNDSWENSNATKNRYVFLYYGICF